MVDRLPEMPADRVTRVAGPTMARVPVQSTPSPVVVSVATDPDEPVPRVMTTLTPLPVGVITARSPGTRVAVAPSRVVSRSWWPVLPATPTGAKVTVRPRWTTLTRTSTPSVTEPTLTPV